MESRSPHLFAGDLVAVRHGQDDSRGRKYKAPPPTAKDSVAVIKDTNGKPIENAAVVFHLSGKRARATWR